MHIVTPKERATHLSSLNHEGKVLLIATILAREPGKAQLYYTIKQDGFEDSALKEPDGSGWEAFKLLQLPDDTADTAGDPSVAAKELAEMTYADGKYLLRSIYASAGLTADAPAQLVSHEGHVYVFRQSTKGTLLVDRFVLDGMSNTLTPKLDVRFKRSRQRHKPLQDMKITSGGQMQSVDALDFRDMQDQPFTEPTIEVCPNLLNNLHDGWFGVVVTPTNETASFCWHIFAHDGENRLNLVTLATGDDRIFDVQDRWFRAIDPVTDQVQYGNIPGIIQRKLALFSAEKQALTITSGPAVTGYDVQREQQTKGGAQLMREASKVLLAVPTTVGTATLSFAIAADGRLAQIANNGEDNLKLLRSQEREILLPIDLLASIRPVGASRETPAGTIVGMSRSTAEDSADRVCVQTDNATVNKPGTGDTVKLSNTTSYNGLYSVVKADNGSFEIDASFKDGKVGDWEKVEAEETGLVFDGMLTGYEKTIDGKLKVCAVNHGLVAGDQVQITGDGDYSGEYPVIKHDDKSFTIERLWASGEAVNVRLESLKRRGLVLDGKRDWINAPFSQAVNLSAGFTVEAWVKLSSDANQTILATQPEMKPEAAQMGSAAFTLSLVDGRFSVSIAWSRPGMPPHLTRELKANMPAQLNEWVHVACCSDGESLHMWENGAIKAPSIDHLDSWARNAQLVALHSASVGRSWKDRKELDGIVALMARVRQMPPTFDLRVNTLILGAAPQLKDGKVEPSNLLQGQVADVRLWTMCRDEKTIKDAMHLQLTGRETGLAGYWRLGGVAAEEDGNGRVFDFSVNANHGVVQGAPYAGGVPLGRYLRDGKTAAVKFSNDELFAVREGAIYVERFEFRTDTTVDPLNADGNNAPIFAPSLWGRLSRTSPEKKPFELAPKDYEFKELEDGWQAATCRFLVPPGVSLVRCFEVAGVAGEWTTLELRRHTLKLVSDTVTLSTLDETANLPALLAAATNPAGLLRELADKEAEETSLITREKELVRQLDGSEGIEKLRETEQRRDAQRAVVSNLSHEEASKKAAYDSAAADPANFWCTISCEHENRRVAADDRRHVINEDPSGDARQRWRFEPVGFDDTGTYSWYVIANKSTDEPLCAAVEKNQENSGINQQPFERQQTQLWRLTKTGREVNSWNIKSAANLELMFSVWSDGMRVTKANGQYSAFSLGFETQRNNKPTDASTALESVRAQLAKAELELASLNTTLSAGDSERAAWQKEQTEIQAKLRSIRERMNALTTQYLGIVAGANKTAQAMPDLPDQKDPRGLLAQGALLPFALPAGRVHALESCAGRVTLSYQDGDGNLRQTHYDTAYDADGKGEEWLPESYRAALALDGRVLALPPELFHDIDSQITVEFWARGGSDSSPFLSALDKDDGLRLLIGLPNEKGTVHWIAGQPTDGATDSLDKAVDAKLYRGAWNHWAFVKDANAGQMSIYLNGKLWAKNDPKVNDEVPRHQILSGITSALLGRPPKQIGGLPEESTGWQGQVCELRIWNVALGEREIEANSVLTLSGNEPGLVAYYPLSEGQGDFGRDHTGGGHDIHIGGAAGWAACTAPIGRIPASPKEAGSGATQQLTQTDETAKAAVICVEYSRARVDAQRRKSAMMLRCLARVTDHGILLLDEQRIEELEMTWIGNAQIKPTLIGYIEGAPPVPSENLTEEQDYNGATSVELIQSSDAEYSWTRENDFAGSAEMEVMVGVKSETVAGPFAVLTSVEEINAGLGRKFDFGYHWQNASTVGASHSLMSSDRLELRGSQEPEANFPHLGKRFIPKNIGYALVSSGLADVFVSKLKRSGRSVGYQVLPVEGVPLDVNTITFLINPAYTMSGSLDGLTGSRATSNRFFKHVPALRGQYGSLYPASYFRLKEAYELKNQIDQQDKAREAYFNQFNARLVDEFSLDRQVDDTSQDGRPIKLDSPDRRGEGDELAAQIKALEDEIQKLKEASQVDQALVDAKEKELKVLRSKEDASKKQDQSKRKEAAGKRQDKIDSSYTDLSARANATDSFASWQRKMETLQIRAGKHNIVNTYVWDGDGGFHTEEQQFASTVEHTVGGSFDLNASIGGQASIAVSKVLVECNAYAKFSLTQTMSKTARSGKGMELHVDLSGVESRGITDYRDRPILPGEKVDRYRFMSFFLESSADHWHDFFNDVVDPEWLASNDEEARALREARSALPNKAWRVLHRVTYVERPALMGFGSPLVKKGEAADDIRSMREQLTDLQVQVMGLQKEIMGKLDQLLLPKG